MIAEKLLNKLIDIADGNSYGDDESGFVIDEVGFKKEAKEALNSWHQQELERAVAEAYRKGYQAGWSIGDSGGRTTKREEVKAKREAWISKKMKEGQS